MRARTRQGFTTRRLDRRLVLAAALGISAAIPACRGCTAGGRPPPERFVSRNAEAVVQVPNIGLLVERRYDVRSLLAGVVTEGQLEALEAELQRILGFDPTTAEGLAAAGLPSKGALAVEIANAGRAALWIVPVEDEKKFRETVVRIAEARATIDAREERTIAGKPATVLATSWGSEKVPVATITVDRGYGFIGAGKRGPALIEKALTRGEAASLPSNPEYVALDEALGNAGAGRFVAPTATVTAARLANREDLGEGLVADLARQLQSVGWAFDLDERAVAVRGRLRLGEGARARLAKVFAGGSGDVPNAVRSAGGIDAVVTLNAAGDPRAILSELAPKGSPLRPRIDAVFSKVQGDLGLDLEKDVLPHLSGHAAVAVGIGDVSALPDPRVVLANPAALLWSVAALGVRDEAALEALEGVWPRIEPQLVQQGLTRSTRKAGDREVTVIAPASAAAPAGLGPVLVESVAAKDAWVLSNDPKRTDRIVDKAGSPPADPLQGRGGLRLDVHFAPLATALRTLDLGAFASGASAMMVRAMISKALQILERLDRAEVRVEHVPDGLSLTGRLSLLPAEAKSGS